MKCQSAQDRHVLFYNIPCRGVVPNKGHINQPLLAKSYFFMHYKAQ